MVSLALSVRREMPRLGGRKLYHLLQADLQGFRGMGRDKFLGLLKEHDLLVGRKRSYTRTTDSRHRFRRYGNLLKNMTICGSEQAWASDMQNRRLVIKPEPFGGRKLGGVRKGSAKSPE